VTELAEAHRYITPPIDENIERIATEFLQSGGGFLSRGRGGGLDVEELTSLRPSWTAPSAGIAAAAPAPSETEPAAVSETEPEAPASSAPSEVEDGGTAESTSTTKPPGFFRRLLSRLSGKHAPQAPTGSQP
jgi:hypothetical protein